MMPLPPGIAPPAAPCHGAFGQQRAGWADDLRLGPGEWDAVRAAAGAGGADAVGRGEGLAPVGPAISPCWVAVGEEAASARGAPSSVPASPAADAAQGLAEAPLPPLRFFLRTARDIEEEYGAV
jgi:hypothetical protein